MGKMNKSLSFFILGLLVLAIVPSSVMQSYAQPVLFGLAHNGPNGPSTLFSIDKTTGVATSIGPTGFERCSGMDFNPGDFTMYATCERSDGSNIIVLVTLNLSTGAATEVGPRGASIFGNQVADLSFRNSDNTLYAYIEAGDGLGTIAVGTGVLTTLGSTGVFCCGNGMAFTPADVLQHALANGVISPTLTTLGTLNQVTGLQTDGPNLIFSAPMDAGKKINGMDFDVSTSTMFGSCNDRAGPGTTQENYLCTVALGSGVVTIIGATVDGLDAIAFIPDITIGGTLIPIDTTTLLLAGVQSISMWMIPVVAAGVGVSVFVIKRRK